MNEIYYNLKDQGYNPLDLNDKFYREICTPYTSENGTDVLLDDREEFIYTSLVNTSVCPNGCNYSEFMFDKKYIKCECEMNTVGIEVLDLEHLSAQNVANSFLTTLKSTNWKPMICYNLVFNFKIFCHNYGSILILILFIVYIVFMVLFCLREISPIKVGVSKIIFEELEQQKEKETTLLNYYDKKVKKLRQTHSEKIKGNYPPKKERIKNKKNQKRVGFQNVSENKEKKRKVKYGINTVNTENNTLILDNKTTKSDYRSTKPSKRRKDKQLVDIEELKSKKESKSKKELKENKQKNLDNFELNNLGFEDACNLDKRSCLKTYWSILLREHIALLTILARNDYNLFNVKIERFLITFCVDSTMNGLFFVHESMQRKYKENKDMTFAEKLPQFLFTILVSHALEVLLCFLGMTDVYVYEIKALPTQEKKKGEKVMEILSKMKRKLVSFYCVTFLLFLFFWYFISAFCAVYQNTQTIFLRDSIISFAISLIDPFFIYGLTSLLRWISLFIVCRKNCCGGCLYKLSNLIPIF